MYQPVYTMHACQQDATIFSNYQRSGVTRLHLADERSLFCIAGTVDVQHRSTVLSRRAF